MDQNPDNKILLLRVRLILQEGQHDRALTVLEGIQPENEAEQQEKAYLLGWGYTLAKRWDDALSILTPLPNFAEGEEDQENRIDRERRALCNLHLGYAAVQIARFDDASRHFSKCLRALQDKKIHLPLTQIKARYGLAMTHLMRGLYPAAVQHYELALDLCEQHEDYTEIGNIYCGLCDTYRRAGNFIEAKLAGEKALTFFERRKDNHMQGLMHNYLGRIALQLGDYRAASDHYTEALTLAISERMMMVNCAALADLRLVEGRLVEARRYCLRAQEISNRLLEKDEQLIGLTYLISGKVAQAEAERTEGEQRQRLLEEAVDWYKRASDQLNATQSYADVAELFGRWAQALEELGYYREAMACWKNGYQALSIVNGPELF
jgi:tetratricopeptide (TPR) repeat protein